MTWTAPWAWLLAAGMVLPVVAHLWSRRRPRAVAFPTLRFLQAASPVSRRLRQVQDWPLLSLRCLIVLLLAAAAAGPASPLGSEGAASPLHRVVVVDYAVASFAAPVIARLREGAARVVLIEGVPIASAIPDAIAAARRGGRSSRHEIALIWDGTAPALQPADVQAIPAHVGVRLEPVTAAAATRPILRPIPALLGGIAAARADTPARDRLLASLAGVRLPDTEIPVQVQWPLAVDSPVTPVPAPSHASRSYDAIAATAADVRLHDAAERSLSDRQRQEHDVIPLLGEPLVRNSIGVPLLGAAVDHAGLTIRSGATVASPLTWWAAVAPLEALVRWERLTSPTAAWPAETRRALTREPAAPDEAPPASGGVRLAWLVVLALLLVEQWWRRRIGAREPDGV